MLRTTAFFTLVFMSGLPALAQPWTGNSKLIAVDDEHPSVPLRLITRPGAEIFKERNKKDKAENQPLPFSVLYVSQNASGNQPMYQVARDTGEQIGFIDKEQVIEWKQALCIKFRQPDEGGRKPVLMFKDAATITGLASREDNSRAAAARDFYSKVEGLGGDYVLPDDFPVLSIEPKRAIDVKTQFYLMPILAHEKVMFGEHEGRALQVSIASKNAARGATTLKNKDYQQAANEKSDQRDAKDAKVEVVYCIDLTQSMQPYVDISLEIVNKVSAALSADPASNSRFSFGLWGYRDHGKEAEGFTVQAFTPQPVPIEGLKFALSQAKASGPTGGDFPEDVLGGVAHAVQSGFTRRDPQNDPIHVLVLIGDAPGHDQPGDVRNGARMAPYQLREVANQNKTWVYAIHIMDPHKEQYHTTAEAQFRALSTNPGAAYSNTYAAVRLGQDSGMNQQAFSQAASQLFTSLKERFMDVSATSEPAAEKPAVVEEAAPDTKALVNDMFRAAIVEWIGRTKAIQAPNDVTAWIPDRDLLNPAVPAVDTCVLLTRNELDQLTQALKTVIEAGMEGKTTGNDFFTCLQSVASTAIRLPTRLGGMKELKDFGLLPDFLLGLPYDSKVLRISNESWSSMPATKQEKFIHEMESLINFYKSLHNSPNLWISLTDNADPDHQVTPVPLEHLP
jgi:serine/threonine-protein kinase PpkA